MKSAQSTPKEKSISEILDELFKKSECMTDPDHNIEISEKDLEQAEQLLTAREASIRINELQTILFNNAREYTITDVEMHHRNTGVDFIEAVDTERIQDRIKQIERG